MLVIGYLQFCGYVFGKTFLTMCDEHIPIELSACIAELLFGLLVWTVMCAWRKVTPIALFMFQPRHYFVELAVQFDP
jgi:hypothetical protein